MTSHERRRQMVMILRLVDQAWFDTFRQSGFSDVYFSRLFTELWLLGDTPLTKSDAYELVKDVSTHTAIKYVRNAIQAGYLEEFDNPEDGRSRQIRMTPLLRERFESVIDRMDQAAREVLGRR
jgi:hypothetical protein